LGSLNETGKPDSFLATLQTRLIGQDQDVKTQQAIEGLHVEVDALQSNFVVSNTSQFYLDQLSYACDVAKRQFVYFIWDAGTAKEDVWSPIQWLIPQTTRRAFFSSPHETLTLIHNDVKANETLDKSQVSWLIHKYSFHDCVVLDVADATEDDPRKKETQTSSTPDFIPDSSSPPPAKLWEKYKSHGGKYIPLPDGTYGEFQKDVSDQTIRSAVSKHFPGAFDLADSFQIDPPDRTQGWPAFAACMAARRLAESCSQRSFKPIRGAASSYGGYTEPLPKIISPPNVPNQQDCDAAYQWRNYCLSVKK
jgi:hypothetical protein